MKTSEQKYPETFEKIKNFVLNNMGNSEFLILEKMGEDYNFLNQLTGIQSGELATKDARISELEKLIEKERSTGESCSLGWHYTLEEAQKTIVALTEFAEKVDTEATRLSLSHIHFKSEDMLHNHAVTIAAAREAIKGDV